MKSALPTKKAYILFFLMVGCLLTNRFFVAFLSSSKMEGTIIRNKQEHLLNDLHLVRVVGIGTVSYGFEATFHDRSVVAKVTGDDFLRYSDVEIEMFQTLNEIPSISNIPKLEMAISRMPNPFTNTSYLKNLGVSSGSARWLVDQRIISVQVMPFLRDSRPPQSIAEFRPFLQSLLTTLEFAHSRNIMHCDLHSSNYHFDGQLVSLYDWNAAFVYRPGVVKMHYHSEPTFLMPPEAWNNKSAVHATVSGFDMYSVGLLTRKLRKKCCRHVDAPLLDDFLQLTMLADPYQRPNATVMLQHGFVQQ